MAVAVGVFGLFSGKQAKNAFYEPSICFGAIF